jgi:hypothetical protein
MAVERIVLMQRVSLRSGARRLATAGVFGSTRITLGALALTMLLVACGHVADDPAQAPVTEAAPTTTPVAAGPAAPVATTTSAAPGPTTTVAGAGCLALLAKAAKLLQDERATMRGIAGPTPAEEARLRAREQALRDEARRLGCRLPAGLQS